LAIASSISMIGIYDISVPHSTIATPGFARNKYHKNSPSPASFSSERPKSLVPPSYDAPSWPNNFLGTSFIESLIQNGCYLINCHVFHIHGGDLHVVDITKTCNYSGSVQSPISFLLISYIYWLRLPQLDNRPDKPMAGQRRFIVHPPVHHTVDHVHRNKSDI